MASHSLSVFMLVLAVAVAWLFIPKEYWIDWDMQRYVVQVKVGRCGNGSFSYMHNLLNSWLFQGAIILSRFTGEFDPLLAARLITVAAAAASAWFVFLTIRLVTQRSLLAIAGGLAWFLVPGNLFLMMRLEDNTWCSAFTTAMLFATITCEGSLAKDRPSTSRSLAWAAIAGLVLAVGINVHQQLAVTFYAFLAALAVSNSHTWARKAGLATVFLTVYWIASMAQNVLAFHDSAAVQSLHRLVYQPYSRCFPHLWFFTSGKTVTEWIDFILTGIRWTYLHDGETWPVFYGAVLTMALVGFVILYRTSHARGTFMFWRPTFGVLLLGGLILVHVPHSLLYEPMNIERWDSTAPGLLVLGFYLASRSVCWLSESRRQMAYATVCGTIMASLAVDAVATQRLLKGYYETYRHNGAVRWSTAVVRHMRMGSATDSPKQIIVLDPVMMESDLQTQLTYAFPAVTVVTVNQKLLPIYHCGVFQELEVHLDGPLTSIPWPADSTFHFMPLALAAVREQCPNFLEQHAWYAVAPPDSREP